MKILTVDVGGTNVKILLQGEAEQRRFRSGNTLTPERMVQGVKEIAKGWQYDVISIGYPGIVRRGQIASEPHNLASGWIGFDFLSAFGCPVKLLNDAAMQALGSYQGGLMLFLGLGTGLGSALIADGVVVPMELGHLSYRDGEIEDYVGAQGFARLGQQEWQRHIEFIVQRLIDAIHPDDVVLGGGNAKKLSELPPHCRQGNNAHAFLGGFRLWEETRAR
ncbi:ROK family protein [Anatilimnocola sp. NA78]|uniref:ROK family protein n=1 Tax=Anatilimnocola sp. NA78 TaxID=3415683 RepID=UPI003CE5967A